jgi:hypothetical protein
MELQSIFLLLGILLVVIYITARPFTRSLRQERDDERRSVLLAEQERLLTALSELDLDQSLGKIPEEDYPIQREDLVRRGAEVMEKLDSLPKELTPIVAVQEESRRNSLSDDEIENLISKRRSARNEKTGSFCPNCGKAIMFSDHFCTGCGQSLEKSG